MKPPMRMICPFHISAQPRPSSSLWAKSTHTLSCSEPYASWSVTIRLPPAADRALNALFKTGPYNPTRLSDLRTSTAALSRDMLASRLHYFASPETTNSSLNKTYLLAVFPDLYPYGEGGHYQPDKSLRPIPVSFEEYHDSPLSSIRPASHLSLCYVRHDLAPAVNRRQFFTVQEGLLGSRSSRHLVC